MLTGYRGSSRPLKGPRSGGGGERALIRPSFGARCRTHKGAVPPVVPMVPRGGPSRTRGCGHRPVRGSSGAERCECTSGGDHTPHYPPPGECLICDIKSLSGRAPKKKKEKKIIKKKEAPLHGGREKRSGLGGRGETAQIGERGGSGLCYGVEGLRNAPGSAAGPGPGCGEAPVARSHPQRSGLI